MELGYMLSETFVINAVRDDDEMKLVMKEFTFHGSIELPQKCWRGFAGLLDQIVLLKTSKIANLFIFAHHLAMVFMLV